MVNGIEPVSEKPCDTTVFTRISMLAKKLGISTTPTLVFEDGDIKPGTLTLDKLNEYLAEASKKN